MIFKSIFEDYQLIYNYTSRILSVVWLYKHAITRILFPACKDSPRIHSVRLLQHFSVKKKNMIHPLKKSTYMEK